MESMNATSNSTDNAGIGFDVRVVVFIQGIFMTLPNLMATIILIRCQSMVMQIRILSIHLTFAEIFFGVFLSFCMIFEILNIHLSCLFRWYLFAFIFLCRGFTVTCLALDRFCCLYFAMRYAIYVTKRSVMVVICMIWILAIALCCQTFLITIEHNECNDLARSKNDLSVTTVLILCYVVMIGAYIGIYVNIKKHHARMGSLTYTSTVKIAAIIASFLLSTLPAHCYHTYLWMNPDIYHATATARRLLNFLSCAGSIVTPFIYVYRFKECRLQLIKFCCSMNKRARKEADEKLKLERAPYLQQNAVSVVSKPTMASER